MHIEDMTYQIDRGGLFEPFLPGRRGGWVRLEKMIIDPDYEWLMINATHIKALPYSAGAVGG